jgi:membrane protein
MDNSTPAVRTDSFKERVTIVAKDIYKIWISERPGQFAAAIAYYAIFAFVPVIYIAFKVTDIVTKRLQIEEGFYEMLSNILGAEFANSLQVAISNLSTKSDSGSLLISIIGFLALLLTASGLFFQLQHILNSIWQVPPPGGDATRTYVRNRLLVFAMLLGVVLVFILAAVINFLITFLHGLIGLSSQVLLLNFIAFAGLATLSGAMIYKVLPNAKVAWHDVWIGGSIFGVSLTFGLNVINALLGTNWFSSAFSAAGSTAIILMGFYFIGQLFVLGAVVIRVYASHYGSGILPKEG